MLGGMFRISLVALAQCVPGGWTHAAADFAHDVLPILTTHCAECHTDGTYKGGFSMDTREAMLENDMVLPGKSAESALVHLITSDDPDERMPREGEPLSQEEIAVLRSWIDEGLAWEEGFSFKKRVWTAPLKPRRPQMPNAGVLGAHPIDRFVAAYFDKHGVKPSAPLSDRVFFRRLFLDLIGVLPDPVEFETFLSDDAPNKREALIDTVLGRRVDYADHWLTFWNDILRNDYKGTGYIDGGRKQITKWLYTALLENKPYDVMARELISPSGESEGFINGIKWRGEVNASQRREVQFAQSVSQVFLGENMKCASCHDSFINDWKLDDAYGLAAMVAEEPLEIHRCDKPTGRFAKARFPFSELGGIDVDASKADRLQQTAALMTSPANGRFTRTIVNRLWQRLMGRGLVEPIDIMGNRPWNEDLLDFLAVHLSDSGYDLKGTLRLIVSSNIYQSATVERHQGPAEDFVFKGPVAKRLTAEQFVDAIWTLTGEAPGKVHADGAKEHERERVRAALVPSNLLMRALGRPNREQIVTVRPEELSTLQALELNNGTLFNGLLEKGAVKWVSEFAGSTSDQLASSVFQRGLNRPPSEEELVLGRSLIGDPVSVTGVADLLWTVVMLPEFQMTP